MPNEVIVALVVAAGSVLCQLLINRDSRRKQDETREVLIYRIDQLEKKQDKHNGLIDRMYQLEKKVDAHIELSAEQIKVANHRIADLEKEES